MTEVGQLLIGCYHLGGTEIDASADDMWLTAGFDIGLEGRLSIELYSEVDDITSFHQTERRGIGPSASDIDTYRTTSPDNLVGIDSHLGLYAEYLLSHHAFSQQCECLVFIVVSRRSVGGGSSEHRIMDACEQGCLSREGSWQWQGSRTKDMGCIVEVELIEHALAVVAGKRCPVRQTEVSSLCHQSV